VWLQTRFGLANVFIDYLYTPHGNASNYSAVDICTFYKSPENLLSLFQLTAPSPALPRQRFQPVAILQLPSLSLLLSGEYSAIKLSSMVN
jgi:hypothetical protein